MNVWWYFHRFLDPDLGNFVLGNMAGFEIIDFRNRLKTLPETNSSHLKMDGWNTTFLLGRPIFRGELLVSGTVKAVPEVNDLEPGHVSQDLDEEYVSIDALHDEVMSCSWAPNLWFPFDRLGRSTTGDCLRAVIVSWDKKEFPTYAWTSTCYMACTCCMLPLPQNYRSGSLTKGA